MAQLEAKFPKALVSPQLQVGICKSKTDPAYYFAKALQIQRANQSLGKLSYLRHLLSFLEMLLVFDDRALKN